jgi:DNA (cytosine-5)-methyltransferase 1
MKQEKQMNNKYKILNLYACLGGNRAKWDEVAKEKGI